MSLRKHINTTPDALVKEIWFKKGQDGVDRVLSVIGKELGGRCIYDKLNNCFRFFEEEPLPIKDVIVQVTAITRTATQAIVKGVTAAGKEYTAYVDWDTYKEEFVGTEKSFAVFSVIDEVPSFVKFTEDEHLWKI